MTSTYPLAMISSLHVKTIGMTQVFDAQIVLAGILATGAGASAMVQFERSVIEKGNVDLLGSRCVRIGVGLKINDGTGNKVDGNRWLGVRPYSGGGALNPGGRLNSRARGKSNVRGDRQQLVLPCGKLACGAQRSTPGLSTVSIVLHRNGRKPRNKQ